MPARPGRPGRRRNRRRRRASPPSSAEGLPARGQLVLVVDLMTGALDVVRARAAARRGDRWVLPAEGVLRSPAARRRPGRAWGPGSRALAGRTLGAPQSPDRRSDRHPPADDVRRDAADDRPGGRDEEDEPEDVRDETGRDQERAAEDDQDPVEDLLVG